MQTTRSSSDPAPVFGLYHLNCHPGHSEWDVAIAKGSCYMHALCCHISEEQKLSLLLPLLGGIVFIDKHCVYFTSEAKKGAYPTFKKKLRKNLYFTFIH